jgi:hypothetical protein
MGGADDEGAVEAAINRSGERDGSFATNASAAAYNPSRVASGKVRQVRFLDAEVAYWQTAAGHLMVNGSLGAPLPRAADAHALDGTRLLVIVCDSKVVLYDLLSKKPFEVTKAQLEGRTPTSIAFLFRGGPHAPGRGGGAAPADGMMPSPILAVGCSDGVVRLVHLATLRVVGRLVTAAGQKTGAVTCVLTLPSQQGYKAADGSMQPSAAAAASAAAAGRTGASAAGGGGKGSAAAGAFEASRDLVVAADSTGALLLWDPFSHLSGSGRDVLPSRAVSAHSGEVWSLCLAPGPEDAEVTSPRLFSCGAGDKSVAVWEPHGLREMWRAKMDPKAPAMSLAYSHRYFNLSGAHALLMTINGSAVMAMYTLAQLPLERALRPCVDLAPLIPPGGRQRLLFGGGRVLGGWAAGDQALQPPLDPAATPTPHIPHPTGQKKVPKVYTVAVSPTRPNLAAVGANSGLAFMTFDRMYPLPVAALPAPNLALAHVSPSRKPLGPAVPHVSYVAHMGDAIWCIACAAAPKVGGGWAEGTQRRWWVMFDACTRLPATPSNRLPPPPPTHPLCVTSQDLQDGSAPHTLPVVLSKERVGSAANQTGRAILGASPTGQYVSCCWPASRRYVVFYRTMAGTWQEVDAGLGVDLAWHSHRWVGREWIGD